MEHHNLKSLLVVKSNTRTKDPSHRTLAFANQPAPSDLPWKHLRSSVFEKPKMRHKYNLFQSASSDWHIYMSSFIGDQYLSIRAWKLFSWKISSSNLLSCLALLWIVNSHYKTCSFLWCSSNFMASLPSSKLSIQV